MASPAIPSTPTEGVCPLSTREIVDRVIQFAEEINNRKFYLYQILFARRTVDSLLRRDGDTVTGLFSRQSGKTEVVACLGLALTLILPSLADAFPKDKRFMGFIEGVMIGIFGPSAKHSGLVYFRMKNRVDAEDFEDILSDPDIDTQLVHSRGDSFSFSNGSKVEAHTASENVLNEGGTYHIVFADESQKISKAKFSKELRPMLSSKNGTMVMIGTANISGGAFQQQIVQNIEVERNSQRRNHFQFDYEQCIKARRAMYNRDGNPEHLHYEKWVAGELARVGGNIEDESFRMNFRLLWHEATSLAIKIHHFKSLAKPHLEMNQPWMGSGRLVGGMDVARKNDSTWITIGHVDTDNPIVDRVVMGAEQRTAVYYNVNVLGWLILQGSFEGEYGQYTQAQQFLRLWPQLDTLYIDATGMGDPVWERMDVLLPGVNVVPFHYGGNNKSNMYKYYLQEISARRFGYCAGPETVESYQYKEFVRQHENLVKETRGQIISVYAADEDDHDDAPDSAAMMCMASRGEAMTEVDLASDSVGHTGVPTVDLIQSTGPHIIPYSGRRW